MEQRRLRIPKMHVREARRGEARRVIYSRVSVSLDEAEPLVKIAPQQVTRTYYTWAGMKRHVRPPPPTRREENLERLQRDTRQPRRNARVTVTDKLGNGYRSELIPSRFFPR